MATVAARAAVVLVLVSTLLFGFVAVPRESSIVYKATPTSYANDPAKSSAGSLSTFMDNKHIDNGAEIDTHDPPLDHMNAAALAVTRDGDLGANKQPDQSALAPDPHDTDYDYSYEDTDDAHSRNSSHSADTRSDEDISDAESHETATSTNNTTQSSTVSTAAGSNDTKPYSAPSTLTGSSDINRSSNTADVYQSGGVNAGSTDGGANNQSGDAVIQVLPIPAAADIAMLKEQVSPPPAPVEGQASPRDDPSSSAESDLVNGDDDSSLGEIEDEDFGMGRYERPDGSTLHCDELADSDTNGPRHHGPDVTVPTKCKLAIICAGYPRAGSTLQMYLVKAAIQAVTPFRVNFGYWEYHKHGNYIPDDKKAEFARMRSELLDRAGDDTILVLKSHEYKPEVETMCQNRVVLLISRNLRDVARSIVSVGWVTSPWKLISTSIDRHHCWQKFTAGKVLEWRYEDIQVDPRDSLMELFKVIGIPVVGSDLDAVIKSVLSKTANPALAATKDQVNAVLDAELANIHNFSDILQFQKDYGYSSDP